MYYFLGCFLLVEGFILVYFLVLSTIIVTSGISDIAISVPSSAIMLAVPSGVCRNFGTSRAITISCSELFHINGHGGVTNVDLVSINNKTFITSTIFLNVNCPLLGDRGLSIVKNVLVVIPK